MASENPNPANLNATDGSPSAISGDIVDPSTPPVAAEHTSAYPRQPGPEGNALRHGLT